MTQMVKKLTAMQETVCSLTLGRSPGEGIDTHSSILAWRIPWTEEAGRLQSIGNKESDTTEWLTQDLGGWSSSYRKGSYFERSMMVRSWGPRARKPGFLPGLSDL